MFTLVFVCAAFLPVILGGSLESRLIGGQDADFRGQFPYSISLQWGQFNNWEHHCGGAIFLEHWVVTSGYCVTTMPTYGARRIMAGLLDFGETITNNIQVVSIDYFAVHPNYTGGIGTNDIALIRVIEGFRFNDFVQPITLPFASSVPSGQGVVSGWGEVTPSGLTENRLQYINVPIYQYEECLDALIDVLGEYVTFLFDQNNFCSGPLIGGTGTCEGDNGDPLVQDGTELIGVVSWRVTPCGLEGAPVLYTRVSAYVDWIYEHVVTHPKLL